MFAALQNRLRDPVLWSTASQLVKTVIAAVVAWVIAVRALDVPQSFLAPWAALLTVHATVFRSIRRGVQQVGATILGVIVAFLAGSVLGVNALSLGAAIFLGLLIGSARGLRAEAATAAATALVVLMTGASGDGHMLVTRLLDTGIGIAVGLVVNLVIWPPLHDRSAARQVDAIDDRLGALLADIATSLRRGCRTEDADDWLAQTRDLDHAIEQAWSVVGEARESGRFNPRRVVPDRMRAAEGFDDILDRLEQAVSETRSMARTIRLAPLPPRDWDPAFAEPWVELLRRASAAITDADGDALTRVRGDLDALVGTLHTNRLPAGFWPVCGALLVNLRNILAALDRVADAQPVQVPPPAMAKAAAQARAFTP